MPRPRVIEPARATRPRQAFSREVEGNLWRQRYPPVLRNGGCDAKVLSLGDIGRRAHCRLRRVRSVERSSVVRSVQFMSPSHCSFALAGVFIAASAATAALDAARIDTLTGLKTMPCGCRMAKEMGVNTWAAFAGTDDNAVVDGDFAVLEDELQPVLKSLRREGINIVAIHHHMTHEQPRMLFLH
jgi:hypothetical protein